MSKHELFERMEELERDYQIALEQEDYVSADQLECQLTYLSLLFSNLVKPDELEE